MIIDEISMVGCNMLATMHLKLQKLNYNILLFDGMNIMFTGDFLEFPPITITPFHSTNIQLTFAFTKQTQKKIICKSLWENHIRPNIIILTKQMLQNKDIQYAYVLKILEPVNFLIQTLNYLKHNSFPI
jgi:hypothetical protein